MHTHTHIHNIDIYTFNVCVCVCVSYLSKKASVTTLLDPYITAMYSCLENRVFTVCGGNSETDSVCVCVCVREREA